MEGVVIRSVCKNKVPILKINFKIQPVNIVGKSGKF